MDHWKKVSSEFKLETIQCCFIDGENVKLVSEEIGYTPSSIWVVSMLSQERDISFHGKI